MIRKIARIDGNENFDYSKAYLVLIGDELYFETVVVENGFVTEPIFKITDEFCRFVRGKFCSELATLLSLVSMRNKYHDYYSEVVKAMKICEITGEDQINVGGIKGLRISQN